MIEKRKMIVSVNDRVARDDYSMTGDTIRTLPCRLYVISQYRMSRVRNMGISPTLSFSNNVL